MLLSAVVLSADSTNSHRSLILDPMITEPCFSSSSTHCLLVPRRHSTFTTGPLETRQMQKLLSKLLELKFTPSESHPTHPPVLVLVSIVQVTDNQ